MDFRHSILPLALALSTALLSSCSIIQKNGTGLAAYQAYDRPAKLPSNPDNVSVKVSVSRQRTYVMEGSELLMVMPVSVGAPATPTPRGDFRITGKQEKKRSKNGSPMPYWCGFKPKLGFHTGWLKHYACTDGCIRMHENVAPKFFRLVEVGTPVNIAYSQPEDATHGRIPLPPDSGPLPDYPASLYAGDGYFKQHKDPTYD